jgi:translation initiation factor IF-3
MIKKEKNTYNEKTDKNVNEYINEGIPFKVVQVISSQGENLGEKSLADAIALAREEQLDLVLVSAGKLKEGIAATGGVPVTKIMNYSKKLYEDKKKSKLAKKKSVETKLKELRLSIKISDHDLQHKVNQSIDFLQSGCRVKFSLLLKGRERVLKDTLGVALMNKITGWLQSMKGDSHKDLCFDEENDTPGGLYRIFYLKK